MRKNMALDAESRRLRAKQVGRLKQSYRLEREGRGRGGRLSQSGLLAMMGKIKEEYSDYSHSTVARWESGEIFPTSERLETFGAALDLRRPEIEGLIALAGLEVAYDKSQEDMAPVPGKDESRAAAPAPSGDSRTDGASIGREPSFAAASIRYCLTRFAFPGLVIAGAGYGLHSLGWAASWMFGLYLFAIICMVLVQGFMKLRRSNELRDLLFVSVFFVLTAPLVQTPLTGTDGYGLYTVDYFVGTPLVYLVALIANLLQAVAAGIVFDLLWRWQYASGSGSGSGKAYQRAAWVAVPPLVLVYACNLIFASVATCFALLAVLPVIAGVLLTLLVLRDKEAAVSEWERRFLLHAALGVTVALTVLGGMAIMVFYWNPSLLSQPNHTTLFISSKIDFDALGYPEAELMDRYRIAATWSSLSILVYMVIVLGGNLIVTIYRLGSGGETGPAEATVSEAVTVPPKRAKRRSNRSQVDARYQPGWLAGHRILQYERSRAGYVPH